MNSHPARFASVAAVLLLLAAACGDSGTTTTAPPATAAPTTTAAQPTTTTTMAPTTTAAPTTTMAPTTTAAPTTTVAETTTTGAQLSGEAQAIVDAKVQAVLAAAPEGWTGALEPDPGGGVDDTDEIYGPCAGEGAFDLTQLDARSLAIEQATVTAPAGSGGGLFPDPEADIEARVFESEEVAADAFAVLETVLGTEDGRDCIAGSFLDALSGDLPPGTEVDFSIDALDGVQGADVGARITFNLTVTGISASVFIDLVATRDGACTVYGTFFSFTEPIDLAIANQLFGAAAGV